MRTISGIILALLVSCSLVSCTSGSLKVTEAKKMPEKGVVHQKLYIRGDSARSYALYFPRSTAGKGANGQVDEGTRGRDDLGKFPLVIAFDPQGNGGLPVEKYKKLAEKYGFILAGSNNSKNGLPPDEIDNIVIGLRKELIDSYPVDTNRIFLMGFSGGARIASLAGFYKTQVAGVIACGAGLAGASAPPVFKIDYFGIAGMGDFNMNEMVELDYPLTQAGLRHVIKTYQGIHAWPPADVMESAFQWFSLNSMKDGIVPKNETIIQEIMSAFEKKVDTLISCGQFLEAANTCMEAIAFGDGLDSTGIYSDKLVSIENMPRYQIQAKYRKKLMELEESERKMLIEALTDKDLKWWKEFEVRSTKYEVRTRNDAGCKIKVLSEDEWQRREETFKNQRVLAYVRLLAYMNANSVLTSKNEEAAVKIVTIYEIVDPENPEPCYMQAILSARKSNTKEALQQLDQAIGKGFKDKLRMAEQPEFRSLKETPGFYDLLQKIKP